MVEKVQWWNWLEDIWKKAEAEAQKKWGESKKKTVFEWILCAHGKMMALRQKKSKNNIKLNMRHKNINKCQWFLCNHFLNLLNTTHKSPLIISFSNFVLKKSESKKEKFQLGKKPKFFFKTEFPKKFLKSWKWTEGASLDIVISQQQGQVNLCTVCSMNNDGSYVANNFLNDWIASSICHTKI